MLFVKTLICSSVYLSCAEEEVFCNVRLTFSRLQQFLLFWLTEAFYNTIHFKFIFPRDSGWTLNPKMLVSHCSLRFFLRPIIDSYCLIQCKIKIVSVIIYTDYIETRF